METNTNPVMVAAKIFKEPPLYWAAANFCYGLVAQTTLAFVGAVVLLTVGACNTVYKVYRDYRPLKKDPVIPILRNCHNAAVSPSMYLFLSAGVLCSYSVSNAAQAVSDPKPETPKLVSNEQQNGRGTEDKKHIHGAMAAGTALMATGNIIMGVMIIKGLKRER